MAAFLQTLANYLLSGCMTMKSVMQMKTENISLEKVLKVVPYR